MPTVIFRYLTRDGFAIVADGKSHKLGTDEPDKANVQKIFQIQEQSAAYALVGTVRFDDDTGKLCSLNLPQEIDGLVRAGAATLCDLLRIEEQLARPIYDLLLKGKADGLITDYTGTLDFIGQRGLTIFSVLLFGYCNGAPSEIHVRFWHQDQVPGKPEVRPFDFRGMNPRPIGSPEIWNALRNHNPALSRFPLPEMPPPERSQEISLWDAAKIGETLILACESKEAIKIDPECRKIGGHIHIAAITPTCFHWLRPPM
ncbi:MAG: hypothetical protein ABSF15_19860 [Candidatus Sulfotelmatobacter sp.]|jgi:hypothetical protein